MKRLKRRGLKVGSECKIYNTYIDYGHCFLIEIGNNVTISNSTLLAHDASTKTFLGKTKIGKIKIEDNVFIGWGSIILPNVKIGSNVIIGAGSVVNKDIPSGSIVAGVPATIIGQTNDFIDKNKEWMSVSPVYDKPWKKKTKNEIMLMKEQIEIFGYDD